MHYKIFFLNTNFVFFGPPYCSRRFCFWICAICVITSLFERKKTVAKNMHFRSCSFSHTMISHNNRLNPTKENRTIVSYVCVTPVDIYVSIDLFLHLPIWIHIDICIYIDIYIYIYIYIHILSIYSEHSEYSYGLNIDMCRCVFRFKRMRQANHTFWLSIVRKPHIVGAVKFNACGK